MYSPIYNTVTLLSLLLTVSCTVRPANENGATFTRVKQGDFVSDSSSSPSASWMDIDRDGDDDLYVLNGFGSLQRPPVPQENKLYRNNGDATFTPLPDHPLVQDVAFSGCGIWGDYDNDGDPDLFVANQQNADNHLYRNDGGGSFTRIENGAPVTDGGRSFSASWIDIDGDGLLDLHVMNGRDGDGGQRDFVYRNRGDGTFEPRENAAFVQDTLASGGAAWADFDNDGDVDVIIPIHSQRAKPKVYRNEGNWNFTDITSEIDLSDDPLPGSPASSVAHWIDYDNDLDLDLFIGNAGGFIDYLFQNDGTGNFTRVTAGRLGLDATYVSDVTWGDFDNDADLDFVIAVWGGASEYFENNGNGAFYPADAGDLGSVINFASSVSANDADGDGDLDLYLTHWPINEAGGEPNQFYLNDGNNGNWLKIKLEGTESNRSAIGATVTVSAHIRGGTVSQMRRVTSRTSWRSSGGLTKHFGLADAGATQEIRVSWPSGATDVIAEPVDVNQTITIKEGTGILK